MKDDAADQLDVVVPHVQHAAAGFANGGERLDKDVVERGAVGEFLLEFLRLGGQLLVARAAASAARAR